MTTCTLKEHIGKDLNGYHIIKQTDYGKVLSRCLECGVEKINHFASICRSKSNLRCFSCEPSYTDLYLSDVKDLLLIGTSIKQISIALGCNVVTVHHIAKLLVESGEIEDYDVFEYSYSEIAKALGISVAQAKNAYDSGLKKLQCCSSLKEYIDD